MTTEQLEVTNRTTVKQNHLRTADSLLHSRIYLPVTFKGQTGRPSNPLQQVIFHTARHNLYVQQKSPPTCESASLNKILCPSLISERSSTLRVLSLDKLNSCCSALWNLKRDTMQDVGHFKMNVRGTGGDVGFPPPPPDLPTFAQQAQNVFPVLLNSSNFRHCPSSDHSQDSAPPPPLPTRHIQPDPRSAGDTARINMMIFSSS